MKTCVVGLSLLILCTAIPSFAAAQTPAQQQLRQQQQKKMQQDYLRQQQLLQQQKAAQNLNGNKGNAGGAMQPQPPVGAGAAGGPGTGSNPNSPVYVKGYYKTNPNGTVTYVPGYYRSAPDGQFGNNYSTKGNINPKTGQKGGIVTPPR